MSPDSSAPDLAARIKAARDRLGPELTILAHHYQRDEVVRHADFVGDSLELSRRVPGLESRFIVFCGVHFMAETSAMLCREGQQTHLPVAGASCVMADAAPTDFVAGVLQALRRGGRTVIPLAYVNSQAGVKALCGKYGGSVCTSANAKAMLKWAFDQGDGVLFLPDRNLAMNTADALDIPPSRRLVLDVRGQGGRIDTARAAGADLLVWPATCPVHQRFRYKAANIAEARRTHPGCRIVVHPECPPSVVRAVDAAGSTSFIIKYVAEVPAGSVIYVGTELMLVNRLAERYRGEKTVLPLAESLCSNMQKTSEAALAQTLETLDTREPVRVDPAVAADARLALQRMLAVTVS
jgi:quinolinate synthase